MSNIRGALVPILLVGFVPTLSILFSLRVSDDETLSQVFFIVCKAWIFLLPTYWFLRVEGNEISRSLPTREGIRMGAITGMGMTMIIVVMWVFLGESFFLILYYYSWDRMARAGRKWIHMSIGVVANAMGLFLLLMANAWASFMMAPAGVDASGRFLGNIWHLLHSPLWNPLNAHRFLADIMSGGAVIVAYAAYRFLRTRSESERAFYDWVGYVCLLYTSTSPRD